MQAFIITERRIKEFQNHLICQERSAGTIAKYVHDLHEFSAYLSAEKSVSKETVIAYKGTLSGRYATSTVNSMLAALNGFFIFCGRCDLTVKPLKRQRQIFGREERELSKPEYLRLLDAAQSQGNRRLFLIMQTICGTGIRVSELQYITAEAVKCGRAEVRGKGKLRVILLHQKLCRRLSEYLRQTGTRSGAVFVTKSGKPVDRSNIWHDMKALCQSAGVDSQKVFPHNLRHLFARTFYSLDKDLAKLADVLGHSSIETTRIYIMESGAAHEKLVSRLGLVV